MNGIIKQTGFYALKNKFYYDYISNFLYGSDIKDNEFFQKLHDMDINKMYGKSFYIDVSGNMGTNWGNFNFQNRYDFENQAIHLNSFTSYLNPLYKKSLQLINYFHETTHEKQRDYLLYNNSKNLSEESSYNKLLSMEVFLCSEIDIYNYEQRLVEIDAIYNSAMKFNELIDKNIIKENNETLSVALYNCVRYFASINGEKHHVYCPNNYSLSCAKIVDGYRRYYSTLSNNLSSRQFRLLEESELISNWKKKEISNIDFDAVEEQINQKTEIMHNLLNEYYSKVVKSYSPSNEMCNHLNINKNNWEAYIAKNNIVKISAIMCDDYHNQFSGKSNFSIKNKENEK